VTKKRKTSDYDEDGDHPAKKAATKKVFKQDHSLVNLLGAKIGDRLKGKHSGEGVLVEITEGEIFPCDESVRLEIENYEAGNQLSPVGEAACRLLGKDYPTPDRLVAYFKRLREEGKTVERSHSTALSDPRNGKGMDKKDTAAVACKFRILNLGALHEHAKEAGMLPEMLQLLDRTDVSAQDVLPLVARHTLCLQCGWYSLVKAEVPLKVSEIQSEWVISLEDLRILPTASLKASEKGKEKEGDPENRRALFVLYGIPLSVSMISDVRSLEDQVKAGVTAENLARSLELMNIVKGLSPTFLKSFLQKTLRQRPKVIEFQQGKVVAGEDAAVVLFLCLAHHRGSFNPEIQKFIRGVTDAFKRLAVIITEDAWFDKAPTVTFMTAGLMTAEMSTFWPSTVLFDAAMKAVRKAFRSEGALLYSSESEKTVTKSLLFSRVAEFPESDFGTCYEVLKRIGAMASDLGMLVTLDGNEGKKIPSPATKGFPESLPLWFGLDFHCCRGIGYVVGQLELETLPKGKPGSIGFPEIFAWLFKTFTGKNFRRHPEWTKAELKDLEKVLMVQGLVFAELLKGGDEDAPEILMARTSTDDNQVPPESAEAGTGKEEMTAHIPVGILSSALGPIPFKDGRQQYLILPSMDDPSEKLVMKSPPRDSKDIDLLDVPQEVKTRAAEWLRGQQLRCKNVLLKRALGAVGSITASFSEQEGWMLTFDKKTVQWEDIRGEIKFFCPHFEVPKDDAIHQLVGVPLLSAALGNTRLGAVAGGDARRALTAKLITESATKSPHRRLPSQRLLSLLTDASLTGLTKVKFPKPGRDGKQAGDLGCFTFDIDAYQLALRLSLVWPGALRPEYPADFVIGDPLLFTMMWREVMEVCRVTGAQPTSQEWKGTFDGEARALKPHQADAVEELMERQKSFGHFVCMDTGSGKTQIATTFVERLAREITSLKFRYVLWIAPREVLKEDKFGNKALIQELRKCGVRKILHCDPTKDKGVVPLPYHFNVIIDDHLRAIPSVLAGVAAESVVVADEVDRMYAVSTQRSSTALMLSGMAVKVLAMTATMIRNNKEDGVAHWMKFAHPCVPITKENWLISMSSVVIKAFDSKIKVITEDIDVEVQEAGLKDDEGRTCLDLLQDGHMAKAAQAVYDGMIGPCCDLVKKLMKEGVLLVASDSKHQAKLLRELGARGVKAGTFDNGPDSSYPVVVVRKDQCRGYNWGIRFGVLLEMPYFGNAADRRQMLGRLKRIGQKRSEIRRIMLVPKGTFLARVYSKHLLADLKNAVLEALGKKYQLEGFE